MNKYKHITCLFLGLTLLIGCTKVDFCDGAIHPHTGAVRFSYRWDSLACPPDSMMVVANRIVSTWHAVYSTTANEGLNSGTCHHGHIGSGKYNGDSVRVDSMGLFEVKQGDYQFIAFNGNTDIRYFDYHNLPEYCSNDSIHAESIAIGYSEYRLSHPTMKEYGKGWKEFNPYAPYIAPEVSPIYVSSVSPQTIRADEEVTVSFYPQSITQNIGFKITIGKDSVVIIDKVIAEISGIPNKINLDGSIYEVLDESGTPYIDRTNKALFKVSVEELNDTLSLGYGELSVIGLISNVSPTVNLGAGILQLAIHAHIDDEETGKSRNKIINARINLYHTLTSLYPPLLVRNEYGRVVHGTKEALIEIDSELHINREFLIDNGIGGDLMDHWEQVVDDIDIDI